MSAAKAGTHLKKKILRGTASVKKSKGSGNVSLLSISLIVIALDSKDKKKRLAVLWIFHFSEMNIYIYYCA